MSFETALVRVQDRVGRAVQTHIDRQSASPIRDAMSYAARGGKRLRAFLVIEAAGMFGADGLHAGAAVECLHAYSLIHDDLPCMDDDDLRRGQPTVHMKWDEATAVLAGDALQTLAFEILARPETCPDPARRLALVSSLADASGASGMVLGQALDIAAETGPALDLDRITALQQGKTGALIEWSATAGALMAGEDPAPLRRYARALGLAFQIADDILDVEGDEARTGKRVGKDADAGKATFVSLLGLEQARLRAARLIDEAVVALAPYGERAENLANAARFVIARQT